MARLAAAARITLELILGALAVGVTILLPNFVHVLRVFKTREDGE